MRRFLIFSLVILFPILISAQVTNIQSRKEIRTEKKAKIEESVKNTLESNKFTFVVRAANPSIGPSITLTSDYDIQIVGDSVYSYLPYFGEAYRTNYGSDEGGIKFENIIYNYQKEFNKRTSFYEIRFEVKEPNDTYRINLNISSSGYGNLKIISDSRQAISYDGILSKLLEY